MGVIFEYGDEGDGEGEVQYNDYGMEGKGKGEKVVELVKMVKEGGVGMEGVGMEGEMGMDYG